MLKGLGRHLNRMRGFTMIELLVVIAIIGVLAVAVLSAINPVEQINKGRDTRTRSDAAELLSSIERYYTTQELFPWNVANASIPSGTTIPVFDPTTNGGVDPLAAYSSTGDWEFVGSLVTSNEVKPAFGQRMYQSYSAEVAPTEAFITLKDVNDDRVAVCFLPTSRQFKLEAAKRCCLAVTTDGSICDSAGVLAGVQDPQIAGYDTCANQTGADWELTTTRNLICLP